jgi:hypothetical protein
MHGLEVPGKLQGDVDLGLAALEVTQIRPGFEGHSPATPMP